MNTPKSEGGGKPYISNCVKWKFYAIKRGVLQRKEQKNAFVGQIQKM